MFLLIIFLFGIFSALGLGVCAAWSDIRGLVIPNFYSILIAAAFGVTYGVVYFAGGDALQVFSTPLSHLLAALIVFGVTLVMYALKGLGAADSKLGTAYALWLGVKGLFPFLFYMALVGGVLGIIGLVLRNRTIVKNARPGGWIARVQAGESKVPYGVAIVAGALASFIDLGYLDIETFARFVSRP